MSQFGPAMIAAIASALAIMLLIRFATRLGLIDHPAGRKDHQHPVPVVGGLGIFVGMCAGALVAGLHTPAVTALILAGAMMVCIGALDDRMDLNWRVRILAQVFASALLVAFADVSIRRLGYGGEWLTLELGWMAWPITLFAVVGVINAINMVDGVDGLAGSLALCSLCVMAVIYRGPALDFEWMLVICGAAVASFLVFNLNLGLRRRALTFMGNSGSALLGLLLAWCAIRLTHESQPSITPALAPWLVAWPLIDCLALIARRLRAGRSPFSADRSHGHHLLLDRGWAPTAVVAVAVAVHLGLALCGLALHAAGLPDIGLIALFIVLIGIYYWIAGMLVSRHVVAASDELGATTPARSEHLSARA